jgi:hypothetical protein
LSQGTFIYLVTARNSGSKRRSRPIYLTTAYVAGNRRRSLSQGTFIHLVTTLRFTLGAAPNTLAHKEPVLPAISLTRGSCRRLSLRMAQHRLICSRSPNGLRSSSPRKLLCMYRFNSLHTSRNVTNHSLILSLSGISIVVLIIYKLVSMVHDQILLLNAQISCE